MLDLLQTTQTSIAISMIDLLISLSLSILLGFAVVGVYRLTHRGLNYERSFLVTLVMISPIVAVVIMLIGSNLALSLGMVGALSIIRFRTVIKDSRDMIYLFWMIAVGLGCGTYNWIVTLVATIFIAFVLFLLHFIKYGQALHSDYVLVLKGQQQQPIESIKQTINTFASIVELRSLDIGPNEWEMVFEVRRFKDETLGEQTMLEELERLEQVDTVSLLAPQLALPL